MSRFILNRSKLDFCSKQVVLQLLCSELYERFSVPDSLVSVLQFAFSSASIIFIPKQSVQSKNTPYLPNISLFLTH